MGGVQRGADRGAGARGERTPHLLSARRRQLTARRPGPSSASAGLSGLVWLAVWLLYDVLVSCVAAFCFDFFCGLWC